MIGVTALACGLQPLAKAKWGAKVGKAAKAGRLGELSLKSTLGALSMAGSLALFSTIESALEPSDMIGYAWLEREKQEYLEEMKLWYRKPMWLSGVVIMFIIIMAGGGVGLRRWKRKAQEEKDQEDQEVEVDCEMRQGLGQEKKTAEDGPVNV